MCIANKLFTKKEFQQIRIKLNKYIIKKKDWKIKLSCLKVMLFIFTTIKLNFIVKCFCNKFSYSEKLKQMLKTYSSFIWHIYFIKQQKTRSKYLVLWLSAQRFFRLLSPTPWIPFNVLSYKENKHTLTTSFKTNFILLRYFIYKK